MARRDRPDATAFGRRAALRRRAIQDQKNPETTGPTEAADRASLIFTGVPEGEAGDVAKGVVGLAPKGFKLAKKGAESTSKYVMRVLKPILSKGAKAVAKVK